jgi:hypothetical protein
MSVRKSEMALAAEFRAVARLLVDGKLAFYSGPRPTTPGAALDARHTALVEFALGADLLWAVDAGGVRVGGMPLAKCLGDGTAEFFRVTDAAGRPVMDGSVGLGKEFDVQVDGHMFKGLPVALPEFSYRHRPDQGRDEGSRPPRRLRIAG